MTATSRRHLFADHQGSIVGITNGTGALLAIDRYDDWGVPDATNLGRFQYTGQAWIPELGMYHYKARIYSPTLGRFLQTDPIGYQDQMNLYAYVGNDPFNMRDPTGMATEVAPNGDLVVTGRREEPLPSSPLLAIAADSIGITIHRPEHVGQTDDSSLLRCLSDAGSGAWEGLINPEGQAVTIVGLAVDSAWGARNEARDSARGRHSGTFGRNATIVPGSNARLTRGQILSRIGKRFIPGYAIANAVVAGGIAAYNSESCQGLVN